MTGGYSCYQHLQNPVPATTGYRMSNLSVLVDKSADLEADRMRLKDADCDYVTKSRKWTKGEPVDRKRGLSCLKKASKKKLRAAEVLRTMPGVGDYNWDSDMISKKIVYNVQIKSRPEKSLHVKGSGACLEP